jgi:hypothetical protein
MSVEIQQMVSGDLAWEDIPESHRRILEEMDGLGIEVEIQHNDKGESRGNIPYIILRFTSDQGERVVERVSLKEDGAIVREDSGTFASVQSMWDTFCEEQAKRDLVAEGERAHERAAREWERVVEESMMDMFAELAEKGVDVGIEMEAGIEIEGWRDWFDSWVDATGSTYAAQALHFSQEVGSWEDRVHQNMNDCDWSNGDDAMRSLAVAHRSAVASLRS